MSIDTGHAFVRSSVVVASLLGTIASASRFDGADLTRVSYQPSNTAFSIWGVIYLLLLLSAFALFHTTPHPNLDMFTGFLAGSLCLCSTWAILVSSHKVLSSAALMSATILAACAVLTVPFDPKTPTSWFLIAGPGLLLGWLTLASGLAAAIAMHSLNWSEPPAWILLPAAMLTTGTSIVTENLFPMLSLLWGAAFSQKTVVTALLAILSLLGLAIVVFKLRDRVDE